MNYNELLIYIASWIKENHNNEITGNILQDVLMQMIQYVKGKDDSFDVDIVNLQTQIDNITLSQSVTVYDGIVNPNFAVDIPAAAGDLYVQTNVDEVWMFNGSSWFNLSRDAVVNAILNEIEVNDVIVTNKTELVNWINNHPTELIKDANENWVISLTNNKKYLLVGKGKGTYGFGQEQIAVSNLVEIGGSGGSGGIPEAPIDGKVYGRKNETWEEIPEFPQPPQNPDYEILSLVNFSTEGTFDEGNQYVVGDATALYPLVWKYEGVTYTIDEEIRLPTSIDNANWRRKDPILLKPNGTVALQEGVAVEASSPQQAVLPTIDDDDYFLGYVDWLPSGANIEAPKTKLSEFENDMNFQTGDEVGMKIAESFNIRIKQNLTAPSATEVISTEGLKAILEASTKVIIKTANFTLDPSENNSTIITEGKTATISPSTKAYQNGYTIAMKNDDSSNAPLVGQASTGWTYSINGANAVSSFTAFLESGGTCTIVRKADQNKFYIDGSIV